MKLYCRLHYARKVCYAQTKLHSEIQPYIWHNQSNYIDCAIINHFPLIRLFVSFTAIH